MDLSTLNPLFLDSTKPIGDKVVTSVELTHIILRDGESLYFEVLNPLGYPQKFTFQATTTKKSIKYTVEVWLKYQHQINYRFVIESEGNQLFSSAPSETLAGHIISEKWEPCFNIAPESLKPGEISQRRKEFIKELKQPSEMKTTTSKPLINPQFFDQFKSLLDDLL